MRPVYSVTAVKEAAEIGREEAKVLLATLKKELVRKVGLRAATKGYIAVVKRAPHPTTYTSMWAAGAKWPSTVGCPQSPKRPWGRAASQSSAAASPYG